MLYINTFEPYHVTHNAYRVANLNEYLEYKKFEQKSARWRLLLESSIITILADFLMTKFYELSLTSKKHDLKYNLLFGFEPATFSKVLNEKLDLINLYC